MILRLFKKNKIDVIKGWGSIKEPGVIEVNGKTFNSKSIVIATGSEPSHLKGVNIDEETIVSSTGALSLKQVPKKLAIIGGGYIGLEMGSVWSRLGSKVTVFEYLEYITPGMDREISNEFKKICQLGVEDNVLINWNTLSKKERFIGNPDMREFSYWFSKNLEIYQDTFVERIEYSDTFTIITNNKKFTADGLIITAPASQTAGLIKKL